MGNIFSQYDDSSFSFEDPEIGTSSVALIIGAHIYSNHTLPNIEHGDVPLLSALFKHLKYKVGIIDGNITKRRLMSSFYNILNRLPDVNKEKEKKVLCLSWFGHGNWDEDKGEFFFELSDRTQISASLIKKVLESFMKKFTDILILLDACHAGGIVAQLNDLVYEWKPYVQRETIGRKIEGFWYSPIEDAIKASQNSEMLYLLCNSARSQKSYSRCTLVITLIDTLLELTRGKQPANYVHKIDCLWWMQNTKYKIRLMPCGGQGHVASGAHLGGCVGEDATVEFSLSTHERKLLKARVNQIVQQYWKIPTLEKYKRICNGTYTNTRKNCS